MKEIPCEVYSRISGYMRPVKQWNKGKAEEFKERRFAKVPDIIFKEISDEKIDIETGNL